MRHSPNDDYPYPEDPPGLVVIVAAVYVVCFVGGFLALFAGLTGGC